MFVFVALLVQLGPPTDPALGIIQDLVQSKELVSEWSVYGHRCNAMVRLFHNNNITRVSFHTASLCSKQKRSLGSKEEVRKRCIWMR